jgi:apurinic endonuclease APN1
MVSLFSSFVSYYFYFVHQCLSIAINRAHKETKSVICVIENMAGQGNVIGGKFEDLRDIITLVEDKTRIGVCLDTCHTFAAGYDIRTRETYEKTFAEFERIVGIQYLKALHLNDSKSQFSSKVDRHENIGKGYIGLNCFKWIMSDIRFLNIPLILETPIDDVSVYQKEVELLYSFVKTKSESESECESEKQNAV